MPSLSPRADMVRPAMKRLALVCLLALAQAVCAQTAPRPKIGLVLSGGGARGLAHIGVLRVLEEISPTQLVYYMAFRTIVPGVTNRDFCGLRIVHEAKDGTFYLLFRSVEHPDCPPRDDYIRGEAFASGFVIKPHKEPGTSITYAHVTVINQADMMGKVPKGVRSKLGRKRQGVLKHLRSYCEARFAEAVKANEHE